MSIIIQFNTPSFIKSPNLSLPSNQCLLKGAVKLEMVSGVKHSDAPGMTDDDRSFADIPSNSVFSTHIKEIRSNNYCFGLPYQDHNYGAPPPPTPPSYSPCPSPAADVAIADEDTNHSIASTTTTTEETHEESVTRCICGFDHDDEYMICCDNCLVWQHVDCMGLDRNTIPETYLCDKCEPRKLDRHKARLLQARKRATLTAKHPSSKQELPTNSLFYGKHYKNNTNLQSGEWQITDSQGMSTGSQRLYGSSDSDDTNEQRNSERRPKTRSKRRRKDDEKSENISKKNKHLKNAREKMEMRRSKLQRSKNKDSTSTADEEAQDAWQYNIEWCEENFEAAIKNQYTSEVQHLTRIISLHGFEKKFYEQLHLKQCHVMDDGKVKKVVCLYDIPRNQPLIEYKGKFLLASEFHDIHPLYNKRLYPFVLFYKIENTEICVDASLYGNDARYVRRSCKPNAEIRHMAYNGNLHLFLQSTKVIFSEDEVTVPLNFNQNENVKDIECACGSDDCVVKPKKKNGAIDPCTPEKRRRSRRTTVSAEDESCQSVISPPPPEKPKPSPVITSPPVTHVEPPPPPIVIPEPIEQNEVKSHSDHESEEPCLENKKKLTREERKIDAYVRAFSRMEKAEKRKQQALEKQKALHPKVESKPEPEKPTVQKEEEPVVPPPVTDTVLEEEPKAPSTPQPKAPSTPQPKAPSTPQPKAKKGKRRRGSGTPSRRRTRTNSGNSSDVLHSLDETPPVQPPSPTLPVEATIPVPEACLSPVPVLTPDSPVPVSTAVTSPVILKTKRFLLHEWLQEKCDTNPVTTPISSPRSIHTEMKWNTSADSATCYVRCTKDAPNAGGISAAHLRRSYSSGHIRAAGGQGSAKKRWLRQAMNDCEGSDEQLCIDSSSLETLDNGSSSPNCQGDIDSPGATSEDIVTPLKKRRLMRESVESAPSPRSPFIETSFEDTDGTMNSITNEPLIDNKNNLENQDVLSDVKAIGSLSKVEGSPEKINGLIVDRKLDGNVEIKKEENKSCKALKDLCEHLSVVRNSEAEEKHSLEEEISCDAIQDSKTQINKGDTINLDEISLPNCVETEKEETVLVNGVKTDETNLVNGVKTDETNLVNGVKTDETNLVNGVKTDETNLSNIIITKTEETILDSKVKIETSGVCLTTDVKTVIDDTSFVNGVRTFLATDDKTKICETDFINGVTTETNKLFSTIGIKTDLGKSNGVQANGVQTEADGLCLATDVKMEIDEASFARTETIEIGLVNGVKSETVKPSLEDGVKTQTFDIFEKSSPTQTDPSTDVKSFEEVSSHFIAENAPNQSGVKVNDIGIEMEPGLAQEQITGVCTFTSVSNAVPPNASSVTSPCIFASGEEKIEPIEVDDNSVYKELNTDKTSPVKEEETTHKPPHPVTKTDICDPPETMVLSAKQNDSTKNRPTDSVAVLNSLAISSVDSCSNNVSCSDSNCNVQSNRNEIVEDTKVTTASAKCEESISSVKPRASATLKRKVSLSEYRMRMKENTKKSKTDESPKISESTGNLLPDASLEQVTLAPLPLFNQNDSSKKQSSKQSAFKKKDSTVYEDDVNDEVTQYRENLNERLKREFGFDVSEGSNLKPSTATQAKSICNNSSPSIPLCIQPPPPPPRLPPRPLIPVRGITPTIIPQYRYIHQPTYPPYVVPGAPYISPQPSPIITPPLHPMVPPVSNIQPPLLPSNHAFTPPGNSLRTPLRHTFAPANAQRFAAIVPQTPPLTMPHNAYPHVYQSGLRR